MGGSSESITDFLQIEQKRVAQFFSLLQTKMQMTHEIDEAVQSQDKVREELLKKTQLAESKVVESLKEFFDTERRFIAYLCVLQDALHELKPMPAPIADYLKDLGNLLESYQTLNLTQGMMDENITLDELLIKMGDIFQSAPFQDYMQQLTDLGLWSQVIAQIDSNSPWLIELKDKIKTKVAQDTSGDVKVAEGFKDFTTKAAQQVSRFALRWKEIAKNWSKYFNLMDTSDRPLVLRQTSISSMSTASITSDDTSTSESPTSSVSHLSIDSDDSSTSLESVENICKICQKATEKFNKLQALVSISSAAEKQMQSIDADPKVIGLRAIMQFPSFSVSSDSTEADLEVDSLQSTLAMLLSKGYPELFSYDEANQLRVNESADGRHEFVCQALDMQQNKRQKLNTGKFNLKLLSKLYAEEQDPLWLVLKSTIPISDSFTVRHKIAAYKEMAEACMQGKIGRNNKYLDVLNLQNQAFVIAKERGGMQEFLSAFGPESELGSYINLKIKEHRSHFTPVSRMDIRDAIQQEMRTKFAAFAATPYSPQDAQIRQDDLKSLCKTLNTLVDEFASAFKSHPQIKAELNNMRKEISELSVSSGNKYTSPTDMTQRFKGELLVGDEQVRPPKKSNGC